jgi:hypothetical protein
LDAAKAKFINATLSMGSTRPLVGITHSCTDGPDDWVIRLEGDSETGSNDGCREKGTSHGESRRSGSVAAGGDGCLCGGAAR